MATIRLPDSMDEALAREALARYLRVGEFRQHRRKLVPLAQARDVHTDEDVFKILGKA